MKDGQESCFSLGNCWGGRETSGKRTAVWLIILDCESLMEYVQTGHSVTRTQWGQTAWRKEKDLICMALTQKQVLGTPCCLCSRCISFFCAFFYRESRGRGSSMTVIYIRWGSQHIQIPSFFSLVFSTLCPSSVQISVEANDTYKDWVHETFLNWITYCMFIMEYAETLPRNRWLSQQYYLDIWGLISYISI